ncbi:hypothetical protein [Halorussus sp. AFM4]|uniref:hypothetical protein n=1 Tax=Halorussus sp. AFM4 TaxID=3421651 RepID=UPI003EB891B1
MRRRCVLAATAAVAGFGWYQWYSGRADDGERATATTGVGTRTRHAATPGGVGDGVDGRFDAPF